MRIALFHLTLAALLISGVCSAENGEREELMRKRDEMVRWQLAGRDITDPKVLEAMRRVERHLFVPNSLRFLAYEDYPLPIGYSQTISQPYIVAYMTQAARVGPDDRVLEIGTGSGYQAAIIAELAKEVYTVELVKELADSARLRLEGMGYKNIKVKNGDGYRGWAEYAPFDIIIVTAAPSELPQELIGQLKEGGRMIIPIGSLFQELYIITKTGSGVLEKRAMPVSFVPMVKPDGPSGEEKAK